MVHAVCAWLNSCLRMQLLVILYRWRHMHECRSNNTELSKPNSRSAVTVSVLVRHWLCIWLSHCYTSVKDLRKRHCCLHESLHIYMHCSHEYLDREMCRSVFHFTNFSSVIVTYSIGASVRLRWQSEITDACTRVNRATAAAASQVADTDTATDPLINHAQHAGRALVCGRSGRRERPSCYIRQTAIHSRTVRSTAAAVVECIVWSATSASNENS